MDLSMFLTESSFSSALIHVRCKGKKIKNSSTGSVLACDLHVAIL